MADDQPPRDFSYLGLTRTDDGHLGGNIAEGDPYTFASQVWNYVIDRFCIRSVLDLGSGRGHAADYFFRKGLRVIAVDGMDANVRTALFPTIRIDLTRDFVQCSGVDLVHCHEVVEHVDARYVENLLKSLTRGRYVLMTNALPGQGGHHHVNEQPTAYWEDQMKRCDCVVLDADTKRIRKIAELEGARYLAETGMLYVNQSWPRPA